VYNVRSACAENLTGLWIGSRRNGLSLGYKYSPADFHNKLTLLFVGNIFVPAYLGYFWFLASEPVGFPRMYDGS
jgi:hypothetical protein